MARIEWRRPIPKPPAFDDRYYLAVDVPKPLEDVQAMRVAEIKAQATAELAKTDWQMLRAIERFIHRELDAEGQELSTKREEIRVASDAAEATVAAAKDVEALQAIKVELKPAEEKPAIKEN